MRTGSGSGRPSSTRCSSSCTRVCGRFAALACNRSRAGARVQARMRPRVRRPACTQRCSATGRPARRQLHGWALAEIGPARHFKAHRRFESVHMGVPNGRARSDAPVLGNRERSPQHAPCLVHGPQREAFLIVGTLVMIHQKTRTNGLGMRHAACGRSMDVGGRLHVRTAGLFPNGARRTERQPGGTGKSTDFGLGRRDKDVPGTSVRASTTGRTQGSRKRGTTAVRRPNTPYARSLRVPGPAIARSK